VKFKKKIKRFKMYILIFRFVTITDKISEIRNSEFSTMFSSSLTLRRKNIYPVYWVNSIT
jgi:hypothetical protein